MSKEKEMELTKEQAMERVEAINERVATIQQDVEQADDAGKLELMNEFQELMKEASELNKIINRKTRRTGTGQPRVSRIGVLKDALVEFQPRSTAIDLEGNLIGVSVDRRNGYHIAQIAHSTGMKFTKKIDQVTLLEPTPELESALDKLIQEQEDLVAEVKAAKEAEHQAEEGEEEGDE